MSRLGIAGRELMKGHVGNAIASLATKDYTPGVTKGFGENIRSELIEPSRWRQGHFFYGIMGADKAFVWGNYNASLIAYQQCPIVSTVINRKAQCHTNGAWKILNADKKESQSPPAKAIRKLLKKPNPMQSGKQFKAQCSVYKQIYGYAPILIIRPVGFENDPSRWKLWNIPPWMLLVQDNQEFFFLSNVQPFKMIRLTYMGYSVDLNPKDVFFLKENQISTGMFMANANMENVSLFLPDSKLFPLESNIRAFTSSLRSRGAIIENRGPQWILSNDSNDNGDAGLFPIDEEDKEELHKDFMRYGIMHGQRRAIITDAKLKLQTVGFDVGQLKLLEGEVQDAKAICDQLNYPPELLGLIDSKYDNQDVAERALYTNSIIPDSISEDEQWADLFGMDDLGLTLCTDFRHVAALQENIAETGKGRFAMDQGLLIEWNNDQLTWNEWRVALGKDPVVGRDLYRTDMIRAKLMEPPPSSTPVPASNSSNNNEDDDDK